MFANSDCPPPGEHPEARRGVVAGRLRRPEVPLVPGQLHQAGGVPAGPGGQQRQPGVARQSQERSVQSAAVFYLKVQHVKPYITLSGEKL